MKKLFVVLIAMLLLWTCSALAEEAEPEVYYSDDWEYILLEDGTVELTAYWNRASADFAFPTTVDDITVSSIRSSVALRSPVRITIPDSIVSIDDDLFRSCLNLQEFVVSPTHPVFEVVDGVLLNKVEKKLVHYPAARAVDRYDIPQDTLSIARFAFVGAAVRSITIPDSVITIGPGAFLMCQAQLDVSAEHPVLEVVDGVLFDKTEKKLLSHSDLTKSSYTIPQGTLAIGDYAFAGMQALSSVTIPDSVVAIGAFAFQQCISIQEITIPSNVAYIGECAFVRTSLRSITIPGNVSFIGENAFSACTNLQAVTYSEGMTSTGQGTFYDCSALENVTLPSSLTTIDNRSFESCTALKTIIIPSGVTSIGEHAFDYCVSLSDVVIPGSVETIGANAFSSCESLQSITIPVGVKSIGMAAFSWCEELRSITIPDGVTDIGDAAFNGCSELISVSIPGSVTFIGERILKECDSLQTVTVPRNSYAHEYADANYLTRVLELTD